MAKFRVTLNPGDNQKPEFANRHDYEGDGLVKNAAGQDVEAPIECWKAVNGLDGIGVHSWPIVVTKIEEPAVEPAPKKEKVK